MGNGKAYEALSEDTATSPEEAKAVWDGLENPTLEKVHERLTFAGKKIKLTTLQYWQTENWMKSTVEDVVEAVQAVDTKVPLVTGNPRNGTKSLVPKKKDALLPDKQVRSLPFGRSLEVMPDDKLMRTAVREAFIASSVIFREAQRQRKALLENPVAFGSLLESLATVVEKCTNCADRMAGIADRLMRADAITAQRTIDIDPTQRPNDPLEARLNEFRRVEPPGANP